MEYSRPGLHTGMGAVERAIQNLKNLIIASLQDEICFTEHINLAFWVIRFTTYTGFKVTPFEFHHGSKLRTELTNIVKDNKSCLSDWTILIVSVLPKQIPIYVGRNEKREVTHHILTAEKKVSLLHVSQFTEEETGKAGYWKLPISIYDFREKIRIKSLKEEKYEEQPKIDFGVTQHMFRTAHNRFLYRKLISTPLKCKEITDGSVTEQTTAERGARKILECFRKSTYKLRKALFPSRKLESKK